MCILSSAHITMLAMLTYELARQQVELADNYELRNQILFTTAESLSREISVDEPIEALAANVQEYVNNHLDYFLTGRLS